MITNRDLDRQLGAWFETRMSSSPPEDLLERSLATVGTTRQRPGWLVPDRWRSDDGRTRPTSNPARVGLVLLALLALVLAASAVGAWFTRPSTAIVPPLPSPPATIVTTPAPNPSPTQGSTPEPVATVPISAAVLAGATDFLLASDTVGWVATPLSLYRTADTGTTWTDVDPSDWSGQSTSALIDGDTAYLASSGSPVTIAATHDGGATWTRVRIDDGTASGEPVFSFQTAAHGFATFFDPDGTNRLHVYGTTDGGISWTGPSEGKVPHMAASLDKLYRPIGGFLWQSAGKFYNKPFDNRFFLSADGGATWTQYTFPIGRLAPRDAMKHVVAIVPEEDGRILLEISADAERNPDSIYESGADTATWRLVAGMPDFTFEAQLLNATDWVSVSQPPFSEVHWTEDAGAHWRTTTVTTQIHNLSAYRFASQNTGWGTEECDMTPRVSTCADIGLARALLVTTDGGSTWTRLGN